MGAKNSPIVLQVQFSKEVPSSLNANNPSNDRYLRYDC